MATSAASSKSAGCRERATSCASGSTVERFRRARQPTPMRTLIVWLALANQGVAAPESYSERLSDLERRVDELKEQVFIDKARLFRLRELLLHQKIAGARMLILHRNEVGSMYIPVEYVYSLDSRKIWSRVDESGKLSQEKEVEVFNGTLSPGAHTMSLSTVYIGNGYGIFSYLKGYRFHFTANYTFIAGEGKQLQLKTVLHEKGNIMTTDMPDRLAVDFREQILR
jgi:hypothetical protein